MRISDWSSDVCSSDLIVVDICACQAEGFQPNLLDCRSIRKQADIVQGNAAPSLDAAHHGIGIHGLYSDNFYLGPQLLHISSDTGNQATTTDRDKNGEIGSESCRERVCQYV